MRSEETGAEWQVWPEPESVAPGSVQETGSYFFELCDAPDAGAAELLIDDIPLEALRIRTADSARWRWLPGFHAGTVEAELRLRGQIPRRFEIVTDPDRRKLSRYEFEVMVREFSTIRLRCYPLVASVRAWRVALAAGLRRSRASNSCVRELKSSKPSLLPSLAARGTCLWLRKFSCRITVRAAQLVPKCCGHFGRDAFCGRPRVKRRSRRRSRHSA